MPPGALRVQSVPCFHTFSDPQLSINLTLLRSRAGFQGRSQRRTILQKKKVGHKGAFLNLNFVWLSWQGIPGREASSVTHTLALALYMVNQI